MTRQTPKKALGDFGERIARYHLEAAGMAVTMTNVRGPSGEIDLLAMDGNDLVFVEVRTRRAGAGAAAESLTPVKVRRMWQCAMDYCETANANPDSARLDVVTLDMDGAGRVVAIDHIRGLEVPEG